MTAAHQDRVFPARCTAHRGPLLHCLADPGMAAEPEPGSTQWLEDGMLIVDGARIVACGPAANLLPRLHPDTRVLHWPERLLVPGFIDTHVHMPQLEIMASYGSQLLDWLNTYTFPAEARFDDPDWALAQANLFTDLLLAHGTTSALVFCTTHAQSAAATFHAAEQRGMAVAAGKCMMDRNAPEDLLDTAQSSYDDSLALLQRWHGRGRLRYAITPRFAPTSTAAQLTKVAQLAAEHPDVLVQTHWAESRSEIEWVRSLFPERADYLDVYQHHGLLGPGTVLAHGVHIDDHDRDRLVETGTRIAHCPTSNTFLGSGLFDLQAAKRCGVTLGLATDVGGGTSLSMLATMAEAYKVSQLRGQPLTPWQAFYLATLGNAEVLHQQQDTGSLTVGKMADFVVLDPASSPILRLKQQRAQSIDEQLFNLMMLGDDRAVAATYVAGQCRYRRPDTGSGPGPSGYFMAA
ncbi:guanine deaminase [Natronospirillum operosum]|uniref:Guanine deaminase n=1 Tax=Natronospirillum operosum TaxID=2759953 RepID=A0A4Z0W438_9GAMM|nr:guanine deaminase [Natronospirillum operosum]TGG92074.1 guanine deaminase [Natronospirillum operosum]